MPLPSSGSLSMAQINAEFGRGNDLNSYRGTTWYTAAGGSGTFSTGAISIGDFYGKQLASPSFSFTITSHIDQANLRNLAIAAGWNQSQAVIATLAAGYYLYSSNVNGAALTIDGSWPGGVTFVNNGYVMGQGGQGGGWFYLINSAGTASVTQNYLQSAGGTAISLGVSCTIQNNSYIGGGGGGGGSISTGFAQSGFAGGGGAGGGVGGLTRYKDERSATITDRITYGGGGGGLGGNGGNGAQAVSGGTVQAYEASAGGGGRVMPGSNTVLSRTANISPFPTATSTGGGQGDQGSSSTQAPGTGTGGTMNASAGVGGSGGGTGPVLAIVSGQYATYVHAGGGGGGYGASGGVGGTNGNPSTFTGAAGGKCVHLNGYTATFLATGTRYGAIS